MAASKEATVILVDVGPGMTVESDEGHTPLEQAKECVEKIIQRKIFSDSKDELALVIFGSTDTNNALNEDTPNEYKNISVLRDMMPCTFELFTDIQGIEGTQISTDFLDAMVVGMDILANQTKGKKFATLRVLIFSNFCAETSDSDLETIVSGFKNNNMVLNVVSPDSYNEEEDEKDSNRKPLSDHQLKSEALMLKILKGVNGESYSFEEALPALTYYQKKSVQSAPWNANLEIGSNLAIAVTGYLKVTECKTKSWSQCYAPDTSLRIIKETTFHLNDETETQVDKEQTVDAYRYGTSLVPFTPDDKANMQYENIAKGLKVAGFTKLESIKRYYYTQSKCHYFVGSKNSKDAQVALSAFIHALHETNMVAIVRYAFSQRSAPRMGFMAPRIRPSYECMVFIQLPFAEEITHMSFPALTSSKKFIPNDEQSKAIDNLIDSMNLISESEDGEKLESFKIKDTVNPFLQRLYQSLQHRAFHPADPLPAIAEHIENKLKPNKEILEKAKPNLEAVKKLFALKENEVKKDIKTGDKVFQNGAKNDTMEPPAKKLKSEDGTSNLGAAVISSITEIGTVNPAGDFKFLVGKGDLQIKEVCRQLEIVIKKLIEDPQLGALQAKAVACLKAYREEAIKRKDADQFNQFMKHLKAVKSGKNKPAWTQIVSEKITLIGKEECSTGGVPTNVAESYLVDIEASKDDEKPKDDDDDAEDLLAEME